MEGQQAVITVWCHGWMKPYGWTATALARHEGSSLPPDGIVPRYLTIPKTRSPYTHRYAGYTYHAHCTRRTIRSGAHIL